MYNTKLISKHEEPIEDNFKKLKNFLNYFSSEGGKFHQIYLYFYLTLP
jgi:hypothetical protein